MALLLDVTLMTGRFDAGAGQDPKQIEWPPHPARVFSALRSVAESQADCDTLRLLERLPAPSIFASSHYLPSTRSGYVVTNRRDDKGGNLSHPGRNSGLRQRRSATPRSPRVRLAWQETLDQVDVERLDDMAARVPYLGRSTSVVLMEAQSIPRVPEPPTGLCEFTPSSGDQVDLWLRAPYPGYTDELEELYDAGLPAWQGSDGGRAMQGYRSLETSESRRETAQAHPVASPYRDLVVLRFTGVRPEGRLTPVFTAALRSLVMGQTADPLPSALHGHGLDGQPHVAYLGLPVTGHSHSDGHLVGLAVAVPGMGLSERRTILRGILGDGDGAVVNLDVPRFGAVELRHSPDEPLPRTATTAYWTGQQRTWVSATPIVLDRYPKHGDIAGAIRRSCALAGLPDPLDVVTSPEPLTPGGVRLRPADLPKRARGRLFCHARITFGQPLAGPVLVGAGRYFGVGLLAPERERGTDHNGIER